MPTTADLVAGGDGAGFGQDKHNVRSLNLAFAPPVK